VTTGPYNLIPNGSRKISEAPGENCYVSFLEGLMFFGFPTKRVEMLKENVTGAMTLLNHNAHNTGDTNKCIILSTTVVIAILYGYVVET